jgi:hypothetical protein
VSPKGNLIPSGGNDDELVQHVSSQTTNSLAEPSLSSKTTACRHSSPVGTTPANDLRSDAESLDFSVERRTTR